jgi:Domain of unknown function (DUF222)/HNH endonuclease
MYDILMSLPSGSVVEDQGDLDAAFGEIAGQMNLLNARLVEVTERLLATDLWQEPDMKTPAHYVAWRLGLSLGRAKEVVRVAERRSSFPTIIEAFDQGQLSIEQVGQVVKAPAWADHLLLDIATISTVAKLKRAMRSQNFEGEPEQPADAPADDASSSEPDTPTEPKPPTDRLSFGVTDNGRWRINGEFGIDDGLRIEAALTERRDALFTEGNESATWAEALVDCCARSLGAVESQPRRDHYRTWIHIDVTAGGATTTDGWRLPMSLEQHLLCDGVVQPVWERDGQPFSVGRIHRIVPDRTRRIVERRDRGCRVPGCTADRFVEIHHIQHWADGGATDTPNLVSLCPKHHRLHHQGELGISGDADEFNRLVFTDRQGRPIAGSAPPTKPTAPPPSPAVPYDPPLRGRFDWNWIGLGWVHPDEMARRRNRWRTLPSRSDRAA